MKMLLSRTPASGFSLIELMVSLTLSLFLLSGMIQLAMSNKTSFSVQQGQAINNENGRYALMYLQQYIAQAGYIRSGMQSQEFPAISASGNCPAMKIGQFIAGNNSGTGLCFRYEASGVAGQTDCTGTAMPALTPVLTEMYFNNAGKTLECKVGATSVVLVDNIANFALSYVINTGVVGSIENDEDSMRYYKSSPTISGSVNEWKLVTGIRVAILTGSGGHEALGPQTYAFPLTSAAMTSAAAGDLQTYRSYQQTIPVRNQQFYTKS